jgi:hypothetical protein
MTDAYIYSVVSKPDLGLHSGLGGVLSRLGGGVGSTFGGGVGSRLGGGVGSRLGGGVGSRLGGGVGSRLGGDEYRLRGDVSTCGPGGRNIISPGFALASDEKENISSILAAVSPPLVEEFLRLLGFTTSVYKS